MIQLQERTQEHDEEAMQAPRRCAGCGAIDRPDDALPWELPHGRGRSRDLYCARCYQVFRTHYGDAEEGIIAALKHFRLHEVFTLQHLREALESLGGVTDEAFAGYLETGKTVDLQPRTFEEESQDN